MLKRFMLGAAGVIAGYFTMAAIVLVLGIAAFLLLGPDRAFNPGAYTPSTVWIGITFVCGLLSAIAGGYVCAAISRSRTAPNVLAGLVLVFGLFLVRQAFSPETDQRPTARVAGENLMTTLANARQPNWVAAMNPLIGVVGILIGAGRPRRHN